MGEVIAFPTKPAARSERAAPRRAVRSRAASTAPAPEWIADVEAALSLGLDGWNHGFDWRPLPTGAIGQRFWRAWRGHKEAMKEAGFHVWREDSGAWGVLYRPQYQYCSSDDGAA